MYSSGETSIGTPAAEADLRTGLVPRAAGRFPPRPVIGPPGSDERLAQQRVNRRSLLEGRGYPCMLDTWQGSVR